MSNKRKRKAFSRRDLLVIIALLGVLGGAVIPAVQWAREHAIGARRANKLSECARAVHLAHDQFRKIPPYFGVYGTKPAPLTFHGHLLPYLDMKAEYDLPTVNPKSVVPAFLSTADATQTKGGAGAVNFPVNLRLFYTDGGLGQLSPQDDLIFPKMSKSFPDGASHTLLFATKYMYCGKGGSMWLDPGNNAPHSPMAATFGVSMALWQQAPSRGDCDPLAGTAVSFWKEAIQVSMCDASVRSVVVGISQTTWQALHTPGSGDVIGPDWVE
jgi:hypothetical protein